MRYTLGHFTTHRKNLLHQIGLYCPSVCEEKLQNPQSERLPTYFKSCPELVHDYEKLSHNRGVLLNLNADQTKLIKILSENNINVPERSSIDVYNPSIIFSHKNSECIAGRVELSDKQSEHNSLVVFFKFKNGQWIPLSKPVYRLQDPNITWIGNQMLFAGVKLAAGEKKGEANYRMAFYSGKDFQNLTEFAEGPWGMKGTRIVGLKNGKIGVYTRPQGIKGGEGNIGFTMIDSISDFEKDPKSIIDNAPLLITRFLLGQWGGLNQIIPLSNTENIIIGHFAYRNPRNERKYFPCKFTHNFETGEIKNMEILAQRSDFPEGPAKAPDLIDITYPAGIINRYNKWYLIAGLSDTRSGMIEVENPMSENQKK